MKGQNHRREARVAWNTAMVAGKFSLSSIAIALTSRSCASSKSHDRTALRRRKFYVSRGAL
jgi:hypothetical protein